MQAVINQEVDDMLRRGVIEPSTSPWSSPVVLIKKATGEFRFYIDMRSVKDWSVKHAYPLPQINGILEKLRQAKYISTSVWLPCGQSANSNPTLKDTTLWL